MIETINTTEIRYNKQRYDFHANFATLRNVMGESFMTRQELIISTGWQKHQISWILAELILNNKMKKIPTLADMRNKRYVITCNCNCCICECEVYIKTTKKCICDCHKATVETKSYKMVRGKE